MYTVLEDSPTTHQDNPIIFKEYDAICVPDKASDSRLMMYKKSIESLPQPPALWQAFQTACNQDASSKELGDIIKDDPVLAAAILRTANAPGLGVRVEITDVGRAVSHLGRLLVRTIVSKHSLGSQFSNTQGVYDMPQLWKHGMAVSALAEMVAEYIPDCSADVASTLGLFHDIGKMSMNLIMQYKQPVILDDRKGQLVYEFESFACTHIDLGILLAKHWQLPDKIIQGIAYHHHPAYTHTHDIPEAIRPEVMAVYIADILAIHLDFKAGNAAIYMPHKSFSSLLVNDICHDMLENSQVAREMERIKNIRF